MFRQETRSYEELYDDFWKDIIEINEFGEINLDQVKRELADYYDLMHNAGSVYYEVTQGRVSKPNTTADAVLSVVQEILQEDQEGREKALEVILDLCFDAGEPDTLSLGDTINRIATVADNALVGSYPE